MKVKQQTTVLPSINHKNNKKTINDKKNLTTIVNANTTNTSNNTNQISKATDFINSVIHEYLLKKDYSSTLHTFQNELETKLKSKAYYLTSFSNQFNEKKIETLFINGEKKEFFSLFYKIFPCHVRNREKSIKNLEFLLEVYFTIYPLYQLNKENKERDRCKIKDIQSLYTVRLEEFKNFLELNKGMYKSNEYISYFAIPYIQNIMDNQIYSHLFESSFINSIHEKLISVIKTFIPLGNVPLLYEVFKLYTLKEDSKDNEKKNIIINQINSYGYESYNEKENEKINEMKNEIIRLKMNEDSHKLTLFSSQLEWNRLGIDLLNQVIELMSVIKEKREEIGKGEKERIELNEFISKYEAKIGKYDYFLKNNLIQFENAVNNHVHTQVTINNKNNSIGENILSSQSNIVNYMNHNKSIGNYKNNNSIINDSALNVNQNIIINDENVNQSIVNNSISILNPTQINKSILEENTIVNNNNLTKVQERINDQSLQFNNHFLLDVQKIKEEIGKLGSYKRNHKENYIKINFILKEIRLRMSNNSYIPIRKHTSLSIFYYDIFGIKSKYINLLSKLIENIITLSETVKLLNVLSSNIFGREYLIQKQNFVKDMILLLKNEKQDSIIRQNVIGILQKLTLISTQQREMIENKVVEIIFSILTSESNLSNYSIEYSLALIMNLCMSSKGRSECMKITSVVYNEIIKFIDTSIKGRNIHIRTFANGILYLLLREKEFKEESQVGNLKEKIEAIYINEANSNIRKQLEYILEEIDKSYSIEDNKKKEKDEEMRCLDDEDMRNNEEEYLFDDDCNVNDSISYNRDIANVSNPEEIRHMHLKSVESFIIKFETDNIEEIKKLNEYNVSQIRLRQKTSLIRNKTKENEMKNLNDDFFTRPITPIQQKAILNDGERGDKKKSRRKGNNEVEEEKKENNEEENKEDDENNEDHNMNENMSLLKKSKVIEKGKYTLDVENIETLNQKAFYTKNQIPRTPPEE